MRGVVIVYASRTPVGRTRREQSYHKDMRAGDLGVNVRETAGGAAGRTRKRRMGCANQSGGRGLNMGRMRELGHHLGRWAHGLVTTLVHKMVRRCVALGVETMCIGIGQGIATVVEQV